MNNDNLLEKIAFAAIPLLFSCIVYLIGTLNAIEHRVTILESKVQVVVDANNEPIVPAQAELAREKLRQDFIAGQTEALVRHESNRSDVRLLTWRLERLEEKNERK